MSSLAFLASSGTLWSLFASMIVLSILFPIAEGHWQLTLLDAISSPEEARRIIAGFTPDQRTAHAWITATLDVAYPLAYGGFFAGSAMRGFPQGRLLALPALLVVPIDLIEGSVQVLALTGTVDWLGLKAVVTPAKFLLFVVALLVAVATWGTWLRDRLRAGRVSPPGSGS